MERYMFQPEKIKPTALVDENLAVYYEGKWYYYKVTYIEPIMPFRKDFGAILAGKTATDKDVEELKQGKGWVAFVRVKPIEDLEITVKIPKAKTRYVLGEKVSTYLTVYTHLLGLEHLTELGVLEDHVPVFDVKNPTDYDSPVNRVWFWGLKAEIEELTVPPEKMTRLEASGK